MLITGFMRQTLSILEDVSLRVSLIFSKVICHLLV
jgi:hypothetical protein